MPRLTRTEIVCGDCAGLDLLPVRTLKTANDECASCGGRSFELASKVCAKLADYLTERPRRQAATGNLYLMKGRRA